MDDGSASSTDSLVYSVSSDGESMSEGQEVDNGSDDEDVSLTAVGAVSAVELQGAALSGAVVRDIGGTGYDHLFGFAMGDSHINSGSSNDESISGCQEFDIGMGDSSMDNVISEHEQEMSWFGDESCIEQACSLSLLELACDKSARDVSYDTGDSHWMDEVMKETAMLLSDVSNDVV